MIIIISCCIHTKVHSLQTPSSSSQTEESDADEEFLDLVDDDDDKKLLAIGAGTAECVAGGCRTVTWTAEILQSFVYVCRPEVKMCKSLCRIQRTWENRKRLDTAGESTQSP